MSDTLDSLPPLRHVIAKHGLSARKRFGQNFLLDGNLLSKIVRAAGDIAGAPVYEVGPGPGGLSRAILAARPSRLTVVEADLRCLPALEPLRIASPVPLEIIQGDALRQDEAVLFSGTPAAVIANLPYNVGTALLVRWLEAPQWPPWWRSLTLMFQKEVAQRITAQPGTAAYGRLAVLVQVQAKARIAFEVPAAAFVPPPKVTSCVVHITPLPQRPDVDMKRLSQVTAAAFNQRRKMLRSALKSMVQHPEPLLANAGIAPEARAETVDVAGFVRLARAAS